MKNKPLYMFKEWLVGEYIYKVKPATQIAKEQNVDASVIDSHRKIFNIVPNYRYDLIKEIYGEKMAENCKKLRSIIYQKANSQKKKNRGKTYEELHGKEKAKKIKEKISMKNTGTLENRFGKEKAKKIKEKIRESKIGEKNPMYTGFDLKMLSYVGKITSFFNFECSIVNNHTCKECGRTDDVDGHHLIRQGTILKILEKSYPKKYKDRRWVAEKFSHVHKEFATKIIVSLCPVCHNKTRRSYNDVSVEKKLILSLDFINEVKKIVENTETQLGKKTEYISQYDNSILFPVSRKESRDRLGGMDFKFSGLDIWNAYEFSTLDKNGKPISRILQIAYDCFSESIVESKSLKLYLNSFNQSSIKNDELTSIKKTIFTDLTTKLKINKLIVDFKDVQINTLWTKESTCVDSFVTSDFVYEYSPGLLETTGGSQLDSIKLYSNLLKSNCRHTKQPDWATVAIAYLPNEKILDGVSFLKYIVSFRNHNEFHEECCERILKDLIKILSPRYLRVECKYTRRGGIDINPIRCYGEELDFNKEIRDFTRTIRQ